MERRSNPRRLWIPVALAVPLVIVIVAGVSQAQQGMPGQPGGPKMPPFPKMPQMPPPGQPGGGFGGQPGIQPGGQPGGGIGGQPGGGIGGQPGGGMGGQPGGGFGGQPGGGKMFEKIWTCSKCGREVGRGDFPPGNCPHCGVRFINGVGGGNPGGGPVNVGSGPNTGPPVVNGPSSGSAAGARIVLIVVFILGGLVLLALLAGGIGLVVWLNLASGKPAKSKRPRERSRSGHSAAEVGPDERLGIRPGRA